MLKWSTILCLLAHKCTMILGETTQDTWSPSQTPSPECISAFIKTQQQTMTRHDMSRGTGGGGCLAFYAPLLSCMWHVYLLLPVYFQFHNYGKPWCPNQTNPGLSKPTFEASLQAMIKRQSIVCTDTFCHFGCRVLQLNMISQLIIV